MKNWKQKISEFYGKKFSRKTGGWFAVGLGEFLPDGIARSYNISNYKLSFERTDGKTRKTSAGRKNIAENKKQFIENLRKIGIVWIGANSTTADWEIIVNYFNNETTPFIKKAIDRQNWFDSIKKELEAE